MSDAFDAVLHEEQAAAAAGHAAGVSAGHAAGAEEGHALGVHTGFDVGAEAGYYYGAAVTWQRLAAEHPHLVSERAARSAEALRCAAAALLAAGGTSAAADGAALQRGLEDLRARFRAAAAQLGVTQMYAPGRGGAPGALAPPDVMGGPHLPPEGASASAHTALSF